MATVSVFIYVVPLHSADYYILFWFLNRPASNLTIKWPDLPVLWSNTITYCTTSAYTVFRNASPAAKEVSAEDILIAEGTATLELADKQSEEGMHREAARNYHTATVYFRVLESMVPRLTSRVHAVRLFNSTFYRNFYWAMILRSVIVIMFYIFYLLFIDILHSHCAFPHLIMHTCMHRSLHTLTQKQTYYVTHTPLS